MLCKSCADFVPRTLVEECSTGHPIEQLISSSTAACPLCKSLQARFLPTDGVGGDTGLRSSVKLLWMRNGANYKIIQAKGQHPWHTPMDLCLAKLERANTTDRSSSVSLTIAEPTSSLKRVNSMANCSAGRLERAIKWLADCLAQHPACVSTVRARQLPRRLVFVGKANAGISPRLVETTTHDENLRYMTLSHCWGTQHIFQLTTGNYAALLLQIPMSRLQQVFRDAISVTQKAAVDYLWIDSLCIIQDSVEDWKQESMNMGVIYSGAVCNIAATAFTDGFKGLFVERDAAWTDRIHVHLDAAITAHDGELFAKGDYHLLDVLSWVNGVDTAPLNKRGWVVQERFLSPRVMHFGARQLFWECQTLEASETFPEGLPREVFTSKVKKSIHIDHRHPEKVGDVHQWDRNRWPIAVTAYSRSSLTFESDKMIAIAGLAKSLQHPFMGSYLGGMWSHFLLSHLTWSTGPFGLRPRPNPYRCPSWSWASVDTEVNVPLMASGSELRRHFLVSICEAETTPLNSDHYGTIRAGFIRFVCPLLCVTLIEVENSATTIIHAPDTVPISFSTLSIQMDVQDDHSDEYSQAITTSKALKFIDFTDNQSASSLGTVHDCLMPVEKRTGDPTSVTGLRLKGLLIRPTMKKTGEFQRIGMFDSESLEAIELLQKSSPTLPPSLYERKGADGRYQICLI